MEHPCAKCGAPVEDGVPFCKQCGAPQIRVTGVDPQPAIVPEVHDSSSGHAIPLPELLPPVRSGRIQWSHALPCAALGGAFSLLLVFPLSVLGASVPAGPFVMSGLAILIGGVWSVRLYSRKVKSASLTPALGAQLGAASGGFGFLFLAVIVVATAVYQADEMRRVIADRAHHAMSGGYDAEKMKQMLDVLNAPGGLGVLVATALFILLVMFVVGSSIGGAWYGAWVRKRLQR